MGARRAGRERRGGRRRRRHRRRAPHREPQPPVGHRALPGRGHRRRRHPARHLHHGRPAHRRDGPAAVRSPRRRPQPLDRRGRGQSGISGYGNSVGVPTVGGEIVFDETYADNPLVNVLCLRHPARPTAWCWAGHRAWATWPCCWARTTGRDGIGGVSVLASAGFGDDAEADAAKRPSVQVGDPFEEKRLIEACLALLDAGLVVGIQDLGGAGLTCATSETASRGRRGHGRRRDRRPAARAGHGAVRGDDQRVPGADAGHRRARRPRPRCWPSARRWEVRARSSAGSPPAGQRRPTAGLRSSTAGTARCWPTCRPRSLHEDAPALRPAAGTRPPTSDAGRRRRPGRPGLPTRPTTAAPICSRCSMDTSWVSSPVRPPAVPQHRRGPGRRRRRAAAPAPGHRRRHRAAAWRSPPTATTAGARSIPGPARRSSVAESAAQPGLRRRPPAGPGQLPQLRQPRAPRGDVAAVGGDRRHGRGLPGARHPGHRRQRQPLQREPRARHRPHPGRRHAGPGRPPRPPPARRRAWSTGSRLVLVGRRPSAELGRLAVGPGRGATAAAGCPRSTWPCTWPVAEAGARPWWPAGLLERRPRRRRRRARRGPGRDGRALAASASPRRGCTPTSTCSARRPSRVVLCVDPESAARPVLNVLRARPACRRRASAWPAATAWSVKDLLDLGLAEATDRPGDGGSPDALGAGTVGFRDGRSVDWPLRASPARIAPADPSRRTARPLEDPVRPADDERRDDDTPNEACGVFGVYAPGQPVAHLTYCGLYALQHRGQESAGMAVSDGDDHHRGQGHGPGVQRLRRAHARRPRRPPGHRPHPLLDHRVEHLAQRPAGVPRRRRPPASPSATTAT